MWFFSVCDRSWAGYRLGLRTRRCVRQVCGRGRPRRYAQEVGCGNLCALHCPAATRCRHPVGEARVVDRAQEAPPPELPPCCVWSRDHWSRVLPGELRSSV